MDLEGVAEGTPDHSIIEYSNNWAKEVRAAGFSPGVYIGFDTFLSGDQLGALKFDGFWKSFSDVPTPNGHGFQIIQQRVITVPVVALNVDENTTQDDQKGKAAHWLVK